jgi:hypothetical protein
MDDLLTIKEFCKHPQENVNILANLSEISRNLFIEKAKISCVYQVGKVDIAEIVMKLFNQSYVVNIPHITKLNDNANLVIYKSFEEYSID